ncbi:MAG: CoA pyrophosphatase [Acidiphilium sp.]|nr:CoA pyrophosphatase [Acidiphilium sp.]MDD4936521.1 CoA pyrophosphatase [Acidiphilium sp.]
MTSGEIRRRLARRVVFTVCDLGTDNRRVADRVRAAAVLVAIEPARGVWLTRRSVHLVHHAGQVALPGGTIDPTDVSPETAALREAQEEIGLDPTLVDIIGRLDDFATGTGFHITPITALIHGDPHFAAAPGEVAAIFPLPLATLLDPALPEWRRGTWQGGTRDFPVWPHPDHVIWGVTAWILYRLAVALRAS